MSVAPEGVCGAAPWGLKALHSHMQVLQANCNCELNCTLGSAQALLLRGMRDCLLYVNDVVVGWPGTQGRLGGALAPAGGKPA